MSRKWLASIVLVGALLLVPATAGARSWHAPAPSLTVGGAVATPGTYSLTQLQALETTFTVSHSSWWWGSRTETDQGVLLETLVNTAGPTLPTGAKNGLLRVTVQVSGEWGRSVTFALGELDPSFGNHPAYLELAQNGRKLPAPELVVPGDTNGVRSVDAVSRITVAVQSPAATTSTVTGANDRGRLSHRGSSCEPARRTAAAHPRRDLRGRHGAAVAR